MLNLHIPTPPHPMPVLSGYLGHVLFTFTLPLQSWHVKGLLAHLTAQLVLQVNSESGPFSKHLCSTRGKIWSLLYPSALETLMKEDLQRLFFELFQHEKVAPLL